MLGVMTAGSRKNRKEARATGETLLMRAAAAGHRLARVILSRFYIQGRFGFAKRLLGVFLCAIAMIRLLRGNRNQIFSANRLHYSPSPRHKLFNDEAIARRATDGTANPGKLPRRRIARWVHAIGAAVAAVLLVTRADFDYFRLAMHWYWATAGWSLLAAWPYGLSYLAAAGVAERYRVAPWAQVLVTVISTVVVGEIYMGDFFGEHLSAG